MARLRTAALAAALLLGIGGTCQDGNNPPDEPSPPYGPSYTIVGAGQSYSSSTDDPDGDLVAIRFDWGDGELSNWSVPVEPLQSVTMSHTWAAPGVYEVSSQAQDSEGLLSRWSGALVVTCGDSANEPPGTPSVPAGPDSLLTGTEGLYSSSSVDPDGDIVSLRFAWGDGDTSGWSVPVASGQPVVGSHSWDSPGTFDVRAQAQDPRGETSAWSDPLAVAVSDSTARAGASP